MAYVIDSPEDVVNLALTRIGYKHSVANLYDGTPHANAALNIFGQTRDSVLRESDWGFAERDLTLTLLKTAPVGGYTPPTVWSSTYPILPWVYEYSYPTDCLKLRALRGSPAIIPIFDPSPVNFRIANDNSLVPPAKVILTNLSGAICVYTAQVTDPTAWESGFVEALAAALARRLSVILANPEIEKAEMQDEVVEKTTAAMTIG